MLTELRLRDLGVIEDASVEFDPGLTVLTGETGAGKTMLVLGLLLLGGGRADGARVRTGAERAVVEGRIEPDAAGSSRALDAGAELDEDGTLVLRRTVASQGRSRAQVGGASTPVGVLSQITGTVLTVHGQHESLRLLKASEQRAALDRFGEAAGLGTESLLARHRGLHARWRAVLVEIADRAEHAVERAREAESLRVGLAEVDEVEPLLGEDTALRAESDRLTNADALRTAALDGHRALAGDTDDVQSAREAGADVGALLAVARAALDGVAEHDQELAALTGRIDEVAYLAADIAVELGGYTAGLEADPMRLGQVHERRAALNGLTRRYGENLDEVLAWAARARDRLGLLDPGSDEATSLESTRDALAAELGELAGKLSSARHSAGAAFAEAVSVELSGLAMPDARLDVHLSRSAPASGNTGLAVGDEVVSVGPDGVDDVEIRLTPHAGSPAVPLHKGASGGELSRVMLAVEVVLAGAGGTPTMVFDEVDAGVGGRAAIEVGRRLARLARTHQVLVVTHLPQVAAYADRHLVVGKDSSGAVTTSAVRAVEGEERVRELARMLAGRDASASGQAHAGELLETARAERDR